MKTSVRTSLIALTLALQFLGLGALIYRYENIVRRGVEVRFACEGYDPYDPFRGRYLQTRVRASCTNLTEAVAQGATKHTAKDNLWALIDPTGETNGLARVVLVAEKPTDEGVWLKAPRVWIGSSTHEASLALPDQFYVNEKLAKPAEEALRKPGASAVAVYRIRNGACVLTGIEVDGKPIQDCARETPAAKSGKD